MKRPKDKFFDQDCALKIRREELREERLQIGTQQAKRCSLCLRPAQLITRPPTVWIEVEGRMMGLLTASQAWEMAVRLTERGLPLPKAVIAKFRRGQKPQMYAPQLAHLVKVQQPAARKQRSAKKRTPKSELQTARLSALLQGRKKPARSTRRS